MDRNSPNLWWQKGVIYQIYLRSFQDSNADGVGDLAGIIQRLDYLSDTLGIDAIWLSPFYSSPMKDFGYDVANYTNVNPLFGDLDTFDRLVQSAHERDIRVIIDFVPNHTSDQHPWFQASRSARDNPKRNWYVWRPAQPDGSPPNNWLSLFGGKAWEWDEQTREYYLHSFLKEQPDLNWRNPEVVQAMLGIVRFWLEREVDGFRLDVAHWILKDPLLRDNPLNPDYDPDKSNNPYDSQIHLYDKGHEDVHEIFRQFRALLDEYSRERSRYSIGEIHIFNWKEWALYYGENLDELHMPFNFAFIQPIRWDALTVRAIVDAIEAAMPLNAWPNYVMGNHDEPRLATRYGQENARLAAMLLLTLRGTPTIYYGEELGLQSVPVPEEKVQDPYGLRVPGKGRDPSRTPMQWDHTPTAGFSTADPSQLWLPLSPNTKVENVAAELEQPDSILNLYRELLRLRRKHPALHAGSYRPVDRVPRSCYLYLRESLGQRFLIALNFSDTKQRVQLQGWGEAQIMLSTGLNRQGSIALEDFELGPREGLVISLEDR